MSEREWFIESCAEMERLHAEHLAAEKKRLDDTAIELATNYSRSLRWALHGGMNIGLAIGGVMWLVWPSRTGAIGAIIVAAVSWLRDRHAEKKERGTP